jgi:hypothetical protein
MIWLYTSETVAVEFYNLREQYLVLPFPVSGASANRRHLADGDPPLSSEDSPASSSIPQGRHPLPHFAFQRSRFIVNLSRRALFES